MDTTFSCSLDNATHRRLLVEHGLCDQAMADHLLTITHEAQGGGNPALLRKLRHRLIMSGAVVLCSRDSREPHPEVHAKLERVIARAREERRGSVPVHG